ncbi:hypothetical protein D3C87_1098590 [compost metagenome]
MAQRAQPQHRRGVVPLVPQEAGQQCQGKRGDHGHAGGMREQVEARFGQGRLEYHDGHAEQQQRAERRAAHIGARLGIGQ